jgi:hypothetical protein
VYRIRHSGSQHFTKITVFIFESVKDAFGETHIQSCGIFSHMVVTSQFANKILRAPIPLLLCLQTH